MYAFVHACLLTHSLARSLSQAYSMPFSLFAVLYEYFQEEFPVAESSYFSLIHSHSYTTLFLASGHSCFLQEKISAIEIRLWWSLACTHSLTHSFIPRGYRVPCSLFRVITTTSAVQVIVRRWGSTASAFSDHFNQHCKISVFL